MVVVAVVVGVITTGNEARQRGKALRLQVEQREMDDRNFSLRGGG